MAKKLLIGVVSFLSTTLLLITVLYGYLAAKNGVDRYKDVKNTKKNVVYEPPLPQNSEIVLSTESGEHFIFLLDYKNREITVSYAENLQESDSENRYNISISDEVFAGFIDRIGGVCIGEGEEQRRITGDALCEMLNQSDIDKAPLLNAILTSVAEKGIEKENIIFLLQNSLTTDLSAAELFLYRDYLAEMLNNIRIIT